MTTRRKKHLLLLSAVALLAALAVAALWTGLAVRIYTVPTDKLTAPVRLVLLTDLHSTIHGEDQEKLVELIGEQNPDALLMAGDMADDEVPHRGVELLLAAVGEAYPCFYVTGNHEFWAEDTAEILDMFRTYGVTVLQGEGAALTVRGQALKIFGVDDPAGFDTFPGEAVSPGWTAQFDACRGQLDGETFSVLLSHRPELVEVYRDSGFDLVAAGHAHGGQVRIPGILNGLYAPNQGFFPQYAGGLYDLEGTTLAVSRGLSISRLPRVFDRPEIVVLDLVPAPGVARDGN